MNADDGTIVATTISDRQGHYEFDVADGLRTGVYRVTVVNREGTTVMSSGEIAITGGDDFERINLQLPQPSTSPPRNSKPRSEVPRPPRPEIPLPPSRQSGGRRATVPQSTQAQSSIASRPDSGVTTLQSQQRGSADNRTQRTSSGSQPGGAARSATKAVKPDSSGVSQNPGSQLALSPSQLEAMIDSVFASLPPQIL